MVRAMKLVHMEQHQSPNLIKINAIAAETLNNR